MGCVIHAHRSRELESPHGQFFLIFDSFFHDAPRFDLYVSNLIRNVFLTLVLTPRFSQSRTLMLGFTRSTSVRVFMVSLRCLDRLYHRYVRASRTLLLLVLATFFPSGSLQSLWHFTAISFFAGSSTSDKRNVGRLLTQLLYTTESNPSSLAVTCHQREAFCCDSVVHVLMIVACIIHVAFPASVFKLWYTLNS